MAFGTLYGYQGNPRARVCAVVAKYEGLDLEWVETNTIAAGGAPASYKEKFPLGLVPGFEKDGWKLTESVAIATYLATYNNKAGLAGSNKEDAASIQQWALWANQHFLPSLGSWFLPLVGRAPYNKTSVEAGKATVLKFAAYLESELLTKTFLVGHRVSIADIFVASVLIRGTEYVLDAEFRKAHPNTTRYLNTIINQAPFLAFFDGKLPTFVEKCVVFTPPKKEPAAPKAAAAPAAPKAAKPKAAAEDEEEAPAAPKAKHPAEALGAAKSFPLDEWKRQYSNKETPDALKWLEENYDAQDYSLWKVEYKYPDELTQVFMSSNLITGFHSRLEASRKYLFGSSGVYGVSNNSKIVGVYMARGSDYKSIFDVAPDWESYNYTPLDFKADREFINGCWEWTNEVDGLKYADGKIFK